MPKSRTASERDVATTAERLFTEFLSPLVAGGVLRVRRPIGGAAAVEVGHRGQPLDVERSMAVKQARVQCARRFVAIDRLTELSAVEWTMAACLHDVFLAQHPGYANALYRRVPPRLLAMASAVLAQMEVPHTLADALSRHTVFSRTFDVVRVDTKVSWWTGSQIFFGAEPSKRLLLWPETRRVHVERVRRPVGDLLDEQSTALRDATSGALREFLSRTPLTDLLSAARTLPAFEWSPAVLGLLSTSVGRTLALRDLAPTEGVYEAFGRALRRILMDGERAKLRLVSPFLGEFVLRSALVAKDSLSAASTADGALAQILARWRRMRH